MLHIVNLRPHKFQIILILFDNAQLYTS
uniref:Uncharacterized protein n=1 Tax=Rhizophora mucronata TaxID=61149 RepID=A0A2P2QGR4_RHIMU